MLSPQKKTHPRNCYDSNGQTVMIKSRNPIIVWPKRICKIKPQKKQYHIPKLRPQAPLPHRPMSAGPILHHHPQHQQQQQPPHHHPHHPHHQLLHRSVVVSGAGRQMGGSHNDIPRYVISPSRGGRLHPSGAGFKVNAFCSLVISIKIAHNPQPTRNIIKLHIPITTAPPLRHYFHFTSETNSENTFTCIYMNISFGRKR